MKIRTLILFILFTCTVFAANPYPTDSLDRVNQHDSIPDFTILDLDDLLKVFENDTVAVNKFLEGYKKFTTSQDSAKIDSLIEVTEFPIEHDSINIQHKDSVIRVVRELPLSEIVRRACYKALNDSVIQKTLEACTQYAKLPLAETDSATYLGNPFFIDLVYMGLPLKFRWKMPSSYNEVYFGKKAKPLEAIYVAKPEFAPQAGLLNKLRIDGRNEITRSDFGIYTSMFSKLPNPSKNKSTFLASKPLERIDLVTESPSRDINLKVKLPKPSLWNKRADAIVQYSQNYVSKNWYKGGVGNTALLGVITGKLVFDNKKKIIWENNGEWRLGLINVNDTTVKRKFNVSEDIFKVYSKFGLKASGNWYYSSQIDFSTQFWKSYKSYTSKDLKTMFLTPIRFNLGIGMNYKYKDLFSAMIAPVSYKHVSVFNMDSINVNDFGIETGKRALNQIGSSFTGQFSKTFGDIKIESRLTYFTNYEKHEIDWEIVANLNVNRFLSTRISLNPRYDNTAITKEGDNEKARIQFKEYMSFGFSFRLN